MILTPPSDSLNSFSVPSLSGSVLHISQQAASLKSLMAPCQNLDKVKNECDTEPTVRCRGQPISFLSVERYTISILRL